MSCIANIHVFNHLNVSEPVNQVRHVMLVDSRGKHVSASMSFTFTLRSMSTEPNLPSHLSEDQCRSYMKHSVTPSGCMCNINC